MAMDFGNSAAHPRKAMTSLVVLDSGEARLISSDSETTSGGALQFWRRDSIGELRLIAAYAPGHWGSTRRVTREEADGLLRAGAAQDDRIQDHAPSAPQAPPQRQSAPSAPRTPAASQAQPQNAPDPESSKPAGWRNRYLGRDSSGNKLTVMHGSKGFFVKAVAPDESSILCDLPKDADPYSIALIDAAQAIRAKAQRQAKRAGR
jgi:hypothetical protein